MSWLRTIKQKLFSLFSWKFVKRLAIQGIIFLITAEILVMVASKLRWIDCEVPNYSFSSYSNFLGHYDKDIGFIHVPNESSYLTRNCFEFRMYYNKYGFRDQERKLKSQKHRVLFLGDSFTEGYGVNRSQRFSNLLDSMTTVECLNFGISGKGTTQHQEIYRKFGVKYDHDVVVVQLYPTNDFTDDQPPVEGKGDRPYWVQEDSVWTLLKPFDKPRLTYQMPSYQKWLRSYSYAFNGYKYFKGILFYWDEDPSDHWSFQNAQMARMLRALEEIRRLAKHRKIVVFTVPSMLECDRQQFSSSPLIQNLTSFCKEQNIHFLDIASKMETLSKEERHALYLQCDGHLSEQGHRFVAKQLGAYVK